MNSFLYGLLFKSSLLSGPGPGQPVRFIINADIVRISALTLYNG